MSATQQNQNAIEDPFSLTVDQYGRLWLHAKAQGILCEHQQWRCRSAGIPSAVFRISRPRGFWNDAVLNPALACFARRRGSSRYDKGRNAYLRGCGQFLRLAPT